MVNFIDGGNRSTSRKPPTCRWQILPHNMIASTPRNERACLSGKLFSSLYSWKISGFALNNNHSLIHTSSTIFQVCQLSIQIWLVDYCLSFSEQYFSSTQDENKFHNMQKLFRDEGRERSTWSMTFDCHWKGITSSMTASRLCCLSMLHIRRRGK